MQNPGVQALVSKTLLARIMGQAIRPIEVMRLFGPPPRLPSADMPLEELELHLVLSEAIKASHAALTLKRHQLCPTMDVQHVGL